MVNELGDRIKALRIEFGANQKELAEKLNISNSTLSQYENGQRIPGDELKIKMASMFNVTVDYLLGVTNVKKQKGKYVKIPVLGYITAGSPTYATENIIDYEEIPEEMAKLGDYFGLRVRGRSMEPRIIEGDVVIVRKQSDISSRDIAIVFVDGEDATVKQVVKHDTGISLIAFKY